MKKIARNAELNLSNSDTAHHVAPIMALERRVYKAYASLYIGTLYE